jgi:hypothetical protein
VRMCVKLFVGESWDVRAAVRRVVEYSSDLERKVVRAANMRLYR